MSTCAARCRSLIEVEALSYRSMPMWHLVHASGAGLVTWCLGVRVERARGDVAGEFDSIEHRTGSAQRRQTQKILIGPNGS
ncbi:protein of unknown function [Pararobbsia alpina]